MPPPTATAASKSSSHPIPVSPYPNPVQIANPTLNPAVAARSTHIGSTNTTTNTTPRIRAIRKTSSAIYLVFQFMQCCLVPPEIDSVCTTPATVSPYSRLSGCRREVPERGMQMQSSNSIVNDSPAASPTPRTSARASIQGSAVATPRTSSHDSMELECVTLRNCPLFCDDGNPTDEPDLPGFASLHRQIR